MPIFSGDEQELFKYINGNIRYPLSAQIKDIQGKVVLCFLVTKSSQIDSIKITHSVFSELDNESISFVKMMSNFVLGKLNGKNVSYWFTLPFSFNFELKNHFRLLGFVIQVALLIKILKMA